MRLKLMAAVFGLALAPTLAVAAGCSHDEARMSCGEGLVWDDTTKACVTQTS